MSAPREEVEHKALDVVFNPKKFKVNIETVESKAELEARLTHEGHDKDLARFREKCVFLFVLAVFGLLALLCFLVAIGKVGSVDDKRWATAVLASFGSGAGGYLFGKSSK